jgi:type IV secretion system protein VirD4
MSDKPRQQSSPTSGLLLARVGTGGTQPCGFLRQPGPSLTSHSPGAPGSLITDASEGHLLLVAPTGSGKFRNVLASQQLDYAGSLFSFDPKGEGAYVAARRRHRMGHQVSILDAWSSFNPPWRTPAYTGPHTINPIQVVLSVSEDLCDDCITLTELICGANPTSLQDPFWIRNAKDLIAVLIGWLWLRAQITGVTASDDGTIGGVLNLLLCDDLVYALAEILDKWGNHPAFPRWIYAGIANFLSHEGEKVRTSVRSEAVSLLLTFRSPRMQTATGSTTMPIEAFQNGEPVSCFLIVPPDRIESHAAYVRVVIASLMMVMTRRRSKVSAQPTLFMLDELAQLGPMPQVKQAVTLLRGYGVRLVMALQSIAQLKGLWPNDWETIVENCGALIHFGATSMTAARQVADLLGDISAEALFRMGRDELVLHLAGQPSRIARRIDYLTDPHFAGRFDANPYYQRAPGQDQGDEPSL